ncbi:hypothetical protein BDQ17DRAFT_1332586 [Cyathus striatus]|nr:hypothetical protein BDQ17DRAFT_1332586 [Cyathus striatus]
MVHSEAVIEQALNTLQEQGVTLTCLTESVLAVPKFKDYDMVQEFTQNITEVLEQLDSSALTSNVVKAWTKQQALHCYRSQITILTNKATGFHFTARKTTESKIREFEINETAEQFRLLAPDVWDLIKSLLSSDEILMKWKFTWYKTKTKKTSVKKDGDGDITMQDITEPISSNTMATLVSHNDDDYTNFSEDGAPIIDADDDEPENMEEQEKM